jgi:hypothetical protein
MERAAYIVGWLTAVLAIVVCFGASPAAAHGVHRHAAAHVRAVQVQPAMILAAAENGRLESAASHMAEATSIQTASVQAASIQAASVQAASIQAAPSRAPDIQPCEAPCCTGHGCGCLCGFVTWHERSFAITPDASRERRPGHDRSRPSRSAEAPSEPPRTFQ